tara:strand:+ start:185 stop:391 length:207 start_codon:yes stop_codon:yes gene_type:complete
MKINNWKDYYEVEDELHEEDSRKKILHKNKSHNKKQWKKIKTELNKKGYDKYVKNKRRESKKGVKPTT